MIQKVIRAANVSKNVSTYTAVIYDGDTEIEIRQLINNFRGCYKEIYDGGKQN